MKFAYAELQPRHREQTRNQGHGGWNFEQKKFGDCPRTLMRKELPLPLEPTVVLPDTFVGSCGHAIGPSEQYATHNPLRCGVPDLSTKHNDSSPIFGCDKNARPWRLPAVRQVEVAFGPLRGQANNQAGLARWPRCFILQKFFNYFGCIFVALHNDRPGNFSIKIQG